jgi:hypothetical protein
MATTEEQHEAFERLLSDALSRAVDFLKFAEAKNAALLAFASAWTVSTVNLLVSGRTPIDGLATALKIALPLFTSAAIVAILSFLPRRNLNIFHKDPSQPKNLLYFRHIASFDTAAYQARIQERYVPDGGPPITQSYLDDLSIQIAANSKIADRKFTMFNIGAALSLMAMAVLTLPMICIGIRWLLAVVGGAI